VPGRSRRIQVRDFTGMDTASVGFVRRVENMVADTPHYRDELNRRHEHALTRIAELEAVADEPFEHTDTLRDKRHRLDTLAAAAGSAAAKRCSPRRRSARPARCSPRAPPRTRSPVSLGSASSRCTADSTSGVRRDT